ncbi:MAG: DUF2933 domain-containing protein [Burkholderiales bacterium]
MTPENKARENAPLLSRFNAGLLAVIAVIAYFLLSEHKAHFINYLPYLLLLACPLLHLFMHGGAHSHGGHSADNGKSRKESDNA